MAKLISGVAALSLALAGAGAAHAANAPGVLEQSAPGPSLAAPVQPARSLASRVYWAPGLISNSGFIVGDTGVIVIDAQISVPAANALLAEIAKVTDKPVSTVILTHSDPDHINGLPALPRGVAVIAQTETGAAIARVIADPVSNGMPPPVEIRDYVPTQTVKARESLTLDGVPVILIHAAPAHTDGDLIVYLPEQKLVYAGDLLTPAIGAYPGIHLNKHGSSLGWIAAVEAMLALDADIFVSGHGEPMTRAQVAAGLAVARQRRSEIQSLVDQGKTLAEIKATLDDKPLPGPASRFPTFVETTFRELTTP
jgi:glyoxylase-like metal-dependent hydrolase (beta-lactamase superfamily II)